MSKTQPISTANFVSHENPIYGLKMKYPSDWLEMADDIGITSNDRYVTAAAFSSPLESSFDNYQECVQIVIDNSIDLDANIAKYMIEKIELTRESYSDFDLLASNTINVALAGNPAYILLYKYSDPISGILQVMETGTTISDKGYYIQYFAEPEKYPVYLPTVQTMFDSFTLV